MPRGYPKYREAGLGPSENTARLIEAMRELEERLAAERAKDRARAMLLTFANKHGLTAVDLRNAARVLGDRKVGDAPVVSPNIKRVALGRAIKKAREAKGLKGVQLGKMVGAKSSGAVAMWERGGVPSTAKYRAALIKHLDLPKDFFAEHPPNKRGQRQQGKANGAAAAH